ncbi:MAG: helix-turn-helix transcriptional regulator [Kiritimatiellae bacterium]|nr:helix-turn-helix transcriptional regulator [Kiritimatiellia bacterium]
MNAELPISLVEPRDFTAALGGLVRALRQRADWTQPELASRSGVPVSTLSRLERTGLASTDRLARILFALDALAAFQDFLVARRRLADLPTDLRSFRPDAPKPVRIRHRHASKGDSA